MQQGNTPRRSAWTDERRAKQAEAIRRWAPWTRSTGPRTAAGKAVSAKNARLQGVRAEVAIIRLAAAASMRELSTLLREIERLRDKRTRRATGCDGQQAPGRGCLQADPVAAYLQMLKG